MAHIQTSSLGLWKPQNLSLDRINSQMMFVDNIDSIEAFGKSVKQTIHPPVQTLADLRAINTSDTALFTTGILIMVREIGMFVFDRSATGGTGSDGNAVVAPITGGGAWVPTTASDMPLVSRYVASLDELDTLLTYMVTNMSNNTFKFAVINGLVNQHPLYGGTGHIIVHKTDNLYATVTMIAHDSDRIARQFTKTRYDGIWGRWVSLPFLDENGKIPLNQLPTSVLPASIE